jgi:CIC family chloride channel protein
MLNFISHFALEKLAGYIPQDALKLMSSAHYHGHIDYYMLFFVLIMGGLISGFLVYTFAPEAEGHGTDSVIRAFHRSGGYLRPIVVPIKIIASAVTIGTGGAAGREGPTALFSAGIGSMYANWRKAGWKRRQIFVLIGMASGLSAVFKAPLGTSIFAIEVLYLDNEFETRELIYILFGPLIAYTITGYLFGWQPIFQIPNSDIIVGKLSVYLYIVLLGIVSGVIGFLLPNIFYGVRDLFRNIKIMPHFKPALGAVVVGLIALYLPEILGGGYGIIQDAIDGKIVGTILLSLLIGKILAFSFTIGSGGSGGVFAPSLFVGAMLGAFMGWLLHVSPAVFAVIGMASVFGAAARTPLSTIIMVAEMTGGYTLLAPATLGVLTGFIVHNILIRAFNPKYVSLYEAQLLNKEYSPMYQAERIRDILICHARILNLDRQVIKREEIMELMEKGESIKVGENKYVFFGTFTKKVKLQDGKYFKRYKGADVLFVFRHGKWLHSTIVTSIFPGDEVLLIGDKDVIDRIKNEFIPKSVSFSKLREQRESIEELDEEYY